MLHNNNTEFSNLTKFVDSLHDENSKFAIDPYNTFTCTMKFAPPAAGASMHTFKIPLFEKDFHHLIEELQLPDIKTDGGVVNLLHGPYKLSTTMPMPVDNTFTMTLINTAPEPIIDTYMYHWLKNVTGYGGGFKRVGDLDNIGKATDLDYYRADFLVQFPHLNVGESSALIPQYVFCNVRPINIETYKPSNKPPVSLYRKVTFTFDYFFIKYV